MHKHDVVVEYEGVEHEESYFSEEGNEESKHSRIAYLLVVVVQLEQVSVLVLVCHVNNQNEEEVQTRGESKPSDEFACQRGEAVDILLSQVTDENCHSEEGSVVQSTHQDDGQLSLEVPIGVLDL